jgi:hypothetical protein
VEALRLPQGLAVVGSLWASRLLFEVARVDLRGFVGTVGLDRMLAVCRALGVATASD